MKMNQEIKELIKASGTRQWKVAEALGISEGTLLRWLRFELSEERKGQIIEDIEKARVK